MDITIPTKEVHCYPNNKPWVPSDPKALLNKKKRADQSSSVFRENKNTASGRVRTTIEGNWNTN